MGKRALIGFLTLHLALGAWSQEGSIDRWHRALSRKVVELTDRFDAALADLLGGGEKETGRAEDFGGSDAFFGTGKYLSETPSAYLLLRGVAAFSSLGYGRHALRVRAHIPLPRTTRRLRLFVADDGGQTVPGSREGLSGKRVGVSYFASPRRAWKNRFFVGLSGRHPYLRWRLFRRFGSGRWRIEPVQSASARTDGALQERTDLYVDRTVGEGGLARLRLYRSTASYIPRGYWGAAISYTETAGTRSGWRIAQSLEGAPAYRFDGRREAGVYRYVTLIGYRRNVWRPWLFLETVASVTCRVEERFRPDYALALMVDLFFGRWR